MGVFKLGKMTFGSIFKKPETVKYPFETKPQPAGLKGHIVIDVESCILCGMCQRGCPTDCITVDKGAGTWSLMPFQCIQCGYCTQVCPKKCLTMDPSYWTASTSKELNLVEVPTKEKAAPKAEKKAVETVAPKVEKAAVVESAPKAAAAVPEEKMTADTVVTEAAPEAIRKLDGELESKIALMDADKAERVRKALMSR